ncbi:hypothetical protein PSTT_13417, partial [Puccinia striiformis]
SFHENRIYDIKITCGDCYPDFPPSIFFLTKINLPCVNSTTGEVIHPLSLFHINPTLKIKKKLILGYQFIISERLSHLNSQYYQDGSNITLETVLVELQREMLRAGRKLIQPPEGTMF